MRIFYSVLN